MRTQESYLKVIIEELNRRNKEIINNAIYRHYLIKEKITLIEGGKNGN